MASHDVSAQNSAHKIPPCFCTSCSQEREVAWLYKKLAEAHLKIEQLERAVEDYANGNS